MRVSASVAVACSLLMSAPAFSASMDMVKGQVSVSNGEGFRPATGGALNAGDVVMASVGSSARVVYGDGCEVNVAPGAVVSIAAESPCTANAQGYVAPSMQNTSQVYTPSEPTRTNSWDVVPSRNSFSPPQQGVTSTRPTLPPGTPVSAPVGLTPGVAPGVTPTVLIGGTLLVGGVIGGVVAANNSSSNNSLPIINPIRPVSP